MFERSMAGGAYAEIESIVRSAVLARQDLMPEEIDDVVLAIMGQASGYGPLLEFFMSQDSQEITEVMVNPSSDGPVVYYGKGGQQWQADRDLLQEQRRTAQLLPKNLRGYWTSFYRGCSDCGCLAEGWVPDQRDGVQGLSPGAGAHDQEISPDPAAAAACEAGGVWDAAETGGRSPG